MNWIGFFYSSTVSAWTWSYIVVIDLKQQCFYIFIASITDGSYKMPFRINKLWGTMNLIDLIINQYTEITSKEWINPRSLNTGSSHLITVHRIFRPFWRISVLHLVRLESNLIIHSSKLYTLLLITITMSISSQWIIFHIHQLVVKWFKQGFNRSSSCLTWGKLYFT